MRLIVGNSDGKGPLRKKELYNACKYLGVPSANVIIIDKSSLPDSLNVDWDPNLVASIIEGTVRNDETIVTFDNYGISGHTNHKACHLAVQLLAKRTERSCYQLSSSRIFVKYLGWTSLLFERLTFDETTEVFMISPLQVINNVYGAMQQHKSQLTWFRVLYLIFSKFVFLNTLTRIK